MRCMTPLILCGHRKIQKWDPACAATHCSCRSAVLSRCLSAKSCCGHRSAHRRAQDRPGSLCAYTRASQRQSRNLMTPAALAQPRPLHSAGGMHMVAQAADTTAGHLRISRSGLHCGPGCRSPTLAARAGARAGAASAASRTRAEPGLAPRAVPPTLSRAVVRDSEDVGCSKYPGCACRAKCHAYHGRELFGRPHTQCCTSSVILSLSQHELVLANVQRRQIHCPETIRSHG